MVRISSERLEESVWRKIHQRFLKTILGLQPNKAGRLFITDFLTEAETVMLAKRLAVVFLILESVSSYRISQSLKVSHSTVLRIHDKLDHGDFGTLQTFFDDRKHREQFWEDAHKAIRMGLPPIVGKGRWAWLDELDKKYKTQ